MTFVSELLRIIAMRLGGIWHWCALAFLIRLALVIYGEWQDEYMLVKYTDVDYQVFTDAARYVTEGSSPYDRATYRYTPLLAWLLVPIILLTPVFGKIIFIICDVFTGLLIYCILRLSQCHQETSLSSALWWLLNPLPMAVSSRGNAESIMSMLVLGTLYTLMQQRTKSAALLYALSVHVKIYPVTYCLPLYFLLGPDYSDRNSHKRRSRSTGLLGILTELFWPNKQRLEFVCVSVAAFVALTSSMYYCYGEKFLEETYLYHVTRRDVRHNFSPYFYMLYLTDESPVSFTVGLLTFLPQAVLLLALSVRYHSDIPFCCFVNTFVFVAFNKVCTSQYFLWYLCLLPLIIPTLWMRSESLLLTAFWFFGQGLWLNYAYYLEFEGLATFLKLWLASLIFFAVNIGILVRLLLHYKEHRTFSQGKLSHSHSWS